MKKFLLLVLALCLCCSIATAELVTVTEQSLTLNEAANTLYARSSNWKYTVVDLNLNPLSEEYEDIYEQSEGTYRVSAANGKRGLLDGQGQVLIAPEYDDVNVISDRWAVGITLKLSTAENYDYKSWGSDNTKFYLIDTVDLYYRSNKVHTFTRMEYEYANGFGDYISIQDRERKNTAYNKEFVESPIKPEYYNEYTENWNTGKVTHNGSGQEAFTAGCTLTPDEVRQYLWIKDNILTDLQGNVIADLTEYYSKRVDSTCNLVTVQNAYKKYGLLDDQGKVLIPCEYDQFGYEMDRAKKSGYLYAVKDGKAGFVSLKDGSEHGFEFLESAGKQRSSFIVVEDPREGTILISALAGELPGRYKSVEIPYYSSCMYAVVEEMDGRIHVIDAFGKDVLEDNPEIKSTYDVSFSNDGTVILAKDIERNYHIYRMDPSVYEQQPIKREEVPVSFGEGDETWTCENGHAGNTGKFCTECGAAKPAEDDGTWTCENGHEGNTGNFCPECGAKRPE